MAQTITEIITLRSATVAAKTDLADMITLAETRLSSGTFGDNYNEAVALLVLHYYAINDRNGAGGPVTSEKEGQLSRTFAAAASPNSWTSTSWGMELITLSQSLNLKFRNRMM